MHVCAHGLVQNGPTICRTCSACMRLAAPQLMDDCFGCASFCRGCRLFVLLLCDCAARYCTAADYGRCAWAHGAHGTGTYQQASRQRVSLFSLLFSPSWFGGNGNPETVCFPVFSVCELASGAIISYKGTGLHRRVNQVGHVKGAAAGLGPLDFLEQGFFGFFASVACLHSWQSTGFASLVGDAALESQSE